MSYQPGEKPRKFFVPRKFFGRYGRRRDGRCGLQFLKGQLHKIFWSKFFAQLFLWVPLGPKEDSSQLILILKSTIALKLKIQKTT